MFRFLILLVVLGVIGVGVAEWANEVWTEAGPAPRETVVLIAPHGRTHDIAKQIESAGAVRSALLFGEIATPNHALHEGNWVT